MTPLWGRLERTGVRCCRYSRTVSAVIEGDGVEQRSREQGAESHRLADHDDGGRLDPRGTGGDVAERAHYLPAFSESIPV